jgi:CRISPR-associated endonuclease Csn1
MIMKKILALDLGVTSFGYAVLNEAEPNRYVLLDNGVIMRDAPYDQKGNSSQFARREYASQRALNTKKKLRIKTVAKLFDDYGLLSYGEGTKFQKENPIVNKWKLRAEDALSRPLAIEELFAIMAHMAKHRGYKSISTEDLIYELELELGLIDEKESEVSKDEKRKVYAALARLEKLKESHDLDTIAQVIHRAVQEGVFRSYRNHDDYEKMIRREDIEHEIETIVKKQCELGALPLKGKKCLDFIEDLHEAITDQVMPENDPSLFGKCSYYSEEYAAPKYSYLYDMYRLYKILADMDIHNYDVTIDDREKIVDFVREKISKGKKLKQLLYKDIRNILGLNPEQKIYGKDDFAIIKGKQVQRALVKFFFISDLDKFSSLASNILSHAEALNIFRDIAEAIRLHKTPQESIKALREILATFQIDFDDRELLALIKGKTPGTLSISHRFIQDALPHFADGKNEAEIKELLGVNTSEDYSKYPKSLKHLHLGKNNLFEKKHNIINNHAVKSLASWSLRRIADLSWRYGSFDEIVIESARDVLPKSIQQAIEKSMNARSKEIDEIIKRYKEQFPSVDRKMARKIKLLEAQDFLDLYSGETIGISELFDGRADIEHIVPRSLGGLTTDYNTVIAMRDTNMQKGNRLPMEWLNGDLQYVNRVEMLFAGHKIDWKKRKNLLASSMEEIYSEVGHSKTLRATSYLESLVSEVLKMYYPFTDNEARRNGKGVRNVPGKTTSKTRAWLGIKSKSRDTNFHHAEDALILATITLGWQQRLHTMLKENYGKSEAELKKLWEKYSPHIEGVTLADYIEEAFKRFMSKGENSLWYRDMFDQMRSVSFWVSKKPLSGSSHKDTIYSSKHHDPDNPDKILPTVRKSILDAFSGLDIDKNRNKWNKEDFLKAYDKNLRQKLWLYRLGNTNDPVFRAIEERADQIGNLLEEYILKEPQNNKEIDEQYKQEINRLLKSPIYAAGKPVYKTPFVDDTFSPIMIERGEGNAVVVRTDDNFMAVIFQKGQKDKLSISKVDINSMHKLREANAMIVYLNEIIYLFNKKKTIHYGALRSFKILSSGARLIALFNPRFPGNPKSQPNKFTDGKSIKSVSIGSATGIIKVHLDFTGNVKSYEKFGTIPEELEQQFLKESGYGLENGTDH